jgi:O-antigen ligase
MVTLASRIFHGAVLLNIFFLSIVFFEPSPSDILFFVIVLFAAKNKSLDYRKFINNLIYWLLLYIYITFNVIGLLKVGFNSDSIKFFFITAYLIIYSLFFSLYTDYDKFKSIRKTYVVSGFLASCMGLAGLLGVLSSLFTNDGVRAKGLFKDPNVYGPFLVPAYLIILGDILFAQRRLFRIPKFLEIIMLFIIALAVLFSFSRAAWVNLFFTTIVYIILNVSRIGKGKTLIVTVMGIVVILLLWFLMPDGQMKDFFIDRAKLQGYDAYRFSAQKAGFDLMKTNILGCGPGQYHNEIYKITGFYLSAHSLYLRVLLENGLGGFICLMLPIIMICLKTPFASSY